MAGYILIHPGVEFKSVEGNSLFAYRYFGKSRADFNIKSVAVHSDIEGCITKAQQAGEETRLLVCF